MKTIKCPCCQSSNTELRGLQEPYIMLCLKCNCKWHESKRQPPQVTPEMAWDVFCQLIFNCFYDADKVYVSSFAGKDPEVVYTDKSGECPQVVAEHYHVVWFGWRNMPPRVRGEK